MCSWSPQQPRPQNKDNDVSHRLDVWSYCSKQRKQKLISCSLHSPNPKTTVFAVFFAPGTKNHGIYSVLWPEPSKNSGIYAVFSMLQDVLLPGQTHKNTRKLQCFGVLKPDENRRKPPTSVQNGASRSGPKNQANGRSVFELSPARLRPHLSKTDRFRASPPPPHPLD